MKKSDLVRLRTDIVESIARLEITTARAKSMIHESAETTPNVLQDESDAAKGELDLENAMRVHTHSLKQQGRLRDAILRMESGNYGHCLRCEEEINLRRLEVMPAASLCVNCQEDHELGVVSRIQPPKDKPVIHVLRAA